MIQPVQQDEALLEDIRRSGESSAGLSVWWLGQSGFLVQAAGRHLLLDPYLSDSLTRKYATTDKPHVRMTERVVAPERLDFIDVVTSSHNHTDHLDAETLNPLHKANPGMRLVIPEANRAFVADRLGCEASWPVGLAAGEHVALDGVVLHGIPAAHNELETDDEGRHKFMGYVVEMGGWTLYHSGDTLHYEGMEDRLRNWSLDLALLPINGNVPARRVAGNLDGREAARLAHDLGVSQVVPCHYEMFEFNTVSPDLFEATCQELGQSFHTMRCGERLQLPPR